MPTCSHPFRLLVCCFQKMDLIENGMTTAQPAAEESPLIQKITQWALNYLSSHGYALKNNKPEPVQDTPWSYVVRFASSEGYVYLKHTPKLLALEAPITQILHDQFHASVPKIIAHNPKLDCFLMKDAGKPLREILKKQFDVELLCKAIDQFTSLQLAIADHVNIFINLGVPDWRLDQLPHLYQQLFSQKELLTADGLSELEIRTLETLRPTVLNLCQKLAAYSIKQTMVQCDFHDNNILIDTPSQKLTFIDLGEIVISHPFFSLVGFLRQAKFHHSLSDKEAVTLKLIEACLKNYLVFESKKSLLDAFEIANVLWFIYEALAQYRLMIACDPAEFMAFQRHGKLSGRLKEFMAVCHPL